MLILFRSRAKDPDKGYATTFLRQLEPVLGEVADAEGDDVLPRVPELPAHLDHRDAGRPLGERAPLTATAYLGAWGIAAALEAGAQVVVTGRVTDASLVVGPAAAHFGWARDNWDRLAGATVAGHVLECGTQATGGNYSFFTEIDATRPGFPIAEIDEDGSAVITKHDGTGGAVTIDTVTAQLLYEIGAPAYPGPDVVSHFDTIRLDPHERGVRISGVKGSPPPDALKVCLNALGGFRNAT